MPTRPLAPYEAVLASRALHEIYYTFTVGASYTTPLSEALVAEALAVVCREHAPFSLRLLVVPVVGAEDNVYNTYHADICKVPYTITTAKAGAAIESLGSDAPAGADGKTNVVPSVFSSSHGSDNASPIFIEVLEDAAQLPQYLKHYTRFRFGYSHVRIAAAAAAGTDQQRPLSDGTAYADIAAAESAPFYPLWRVLFVPGTNSLYFITDTSFSTALRLRISTSFSPMPFSVCKQRRMLPPSPSTPPLFSRNQTCRTPPRSFASSPAARPPPSRPPPAPSRWR